jgi:hypothetical protein
MNFFQPRVTGGALFFVDTCQRAMSRLIGGGFPLAGEESTVEMARLFVMTAARRSPRNRSHGHRTESTQAARATRGRASRHRSGGRAQWGPAPLGVGSPGTIRSTADRQRPLRRASSVGRVGISPAPSPSADESRRFIMLRWRQGLAGPQWGVICANFSRQVCYWFSPCVRRTLSS